MLLNRYFHSTEFGALRPGHYLFFWVWATGPTGQIGRRRWRSRRRRTSRFSLRPLRIKSLSRRGGVLTYIHSSSRDSLFRCLFEHAFEATNAARRNTDDKTRVDESNDDKFRSDVLLLHESRRSSMHKRTIERERFVGYPLQ